MSSDNTCSAKFIPKSISDARPCAKLVANLSHSIPCIILLTLCPNSFPLAPQSVPNNTSHIAVVIPFTPFTTNDSIASKSILSKALFISSDKCTPNESQSKVSAKPAKNLNIELNLFSKN